MSNEKKITPKNLDQFIISWNTLFKWDRVWRKKYNIPFGSEAHLKANPIDIYLDIREDIYFNKAQQKYMQSLKDFEDYQKTGNFLKEEILSEEEEDALFKKIKFPS